MNVTSLLLHIGERDAVTQFEIDLHQGLKTVLASSDKPQEERGFLDQVTRIATNNLEEGVLTLSTSDQERPVRFRQVNPERLQFAKQLSPGSDEYNTAIQEIADELLCRSMEEGWQFGRERHDDNQLIEFKNKADQLDGVTHTFTVRSNLERGPCCIVFINVFYDPQYEDVNRLKETLIGHYNMYDQQYIDEINDIVRVAFSSLSKSASSSNRRN